MQGLATFFVRDNEWRQHQALGYQTTAAVYFGSYLYQTILILTLFCLDYVVRFTWLPLFYCSYPNPSKHFPSSIFSQNVRPLVLCRKYTHSAPRPARGSLPCSG